MPASARDQFAARQVDKMSSADADLKPVVRTALSDWDASRQWWRPIVEYSAGIYEDLTGYPAPSSFTDRLGDVLAKTKRPEDTYGDSVERVTEWVSTFIVNSAEYAAGESGSQKQWITMHDDRVRAAHKELDGRTIPSGEKFQVGGSKLRFPGEPIGDPSVWINCRCILRMLKGETMSAETEVFVGPHLDAENEVPHEDAPAENPDDPKVDDDTEVPFHGVAAPTDKPTGDRRQLSRDGFNVRPLPLPLFYQRAQGEGHGGSTVIGRLTSIAVDDATGNVTYEGFFNFTPEAGEAIQGVSEGWLKGVSVDLDDVQVDYDQAAPVLPEDATDADVMDAMQNTVTTFKSWRIAGLTVVGIPAFHEAFIALGTKAEADAALQHEETPATQEEQALVAAAFAPGTHDGPGWITHPVPTGRIRRYWTHGVGAGKIKWGVPGDFNRCRTQLAKYIANPEWLAGACANMHKEATGVWPGRENGQHAAERESLVAAGARMAEAFNLVASAEPASLPSPAFFEDPLLSAPTPITIEGERVFGHIATWGTCHIGFGGTCTEAPHSETNYSWFRLGAVETTAGIVPVGQITLGTGHAGLNADWKAAASHYDNTGTAVADIVTGEDGVGIWFSGRIRPGVTDEQRAELLGAKLSGDWRRIRGSLELVAALAVNTPGFGIPRLSLAASGMQETALVAAGIVDEPITVEPTLTLDEQIAAKVARAFALRDLREKTAPLRASARAARIAALRDRNGR